MLCIRSWRHSIAIALSSFSKDRLTLNWKDDNGWHRIWTFCHGDIRVVFIAAFLLVLAKIMDTFNTTDIDILCRTSNSQAMSVYPALRYKYFTND